MTRTHTFCVSCPVRSSPWRRKRAFVAVSGERALGEGCRDRAEGSAPNLAEPGGIGELARLPCVAEEGSWDCSPTWREPCRRSGGSSHRHRPGGHRRRLWKRYRHHSESLAEALASVPLDRRGCFIGTMRREKPRARFKRLPMIPGSARRQNSMQMEHERRLL